MIERKVQRAALTSSVETVAVPFSHRNCLATEQRENFHWACCSLKNVKQILVMVFHFCCCPPLPRKRLKRVLTESMSKCTSIINFTHLQNNCTNRSVRQHRTMSAVLCVCCFINILRVATSNKFNQAKTKTNQRMFCNLTVAYRQKTDTRKEETREEERQADEEREKLYGNWASAARRRTKTMLHFWVLGPDKPQWHLEALFGDICRSYGTVKHTHSHTHTKSTYKFGSEKTLVSFAWAADTAPKIMFEVSSLQTCCMLLVQWVTPALGHTTSTPNSNSN